MVNEVIGLEERSGVISNGIMKSVGVDNCGDGGPMNEIIYLKKEIYLVTTLSLLSLCSGDKD